MRRAGKSQEEVATVVGVTRQTVDNWETGISIDGVVNTYTPPDLKVKIPKKEKQGIRDRVGFSALYRCP